MCYPQLQSRLKGKHLLNNNKTSFMSMFLNLILAVSSLFLSFSNREDFHQYLSLFENIELPINIDSSFLNTNTIPQRYPIDSALISSFIEQNHLMIEEISLFDIYTYYPVYKFQLSNGIIGVIYAKIGMSGGSEDFFILNLYSVDGEKKGELLVGKYVSDCSFIEETTSVVSHDKARITHAYYEGNCAKDVYFKTRTDEILYEINPFSGNIKMAED